MTDSLGAATEPTGRDFDYGVGDELDAVVRQARREIAAEIRRAAAADPDLTPAAERAYERAARVAEDSAHESADARTPHRTSHRY